MTARDERRGRLAPARKTGAALSTGLMGTAIVVGGSAAAASPADAPTTAPSTTAPPTTAPPTTAPSTTTTTTAGATTSTTAPEGGSSTTTSTTVAATTTTTSGVGQRARADTGTGKAITVSVSPKTVRANGTDQATVTAVVTYPCGSGTCYDPTEQPGFGGSMVFTSSDPDEKFGPVTYPSLGPSDDPATGTYTVTVTASTTAEVATITATGTTTWAGFQTPAVRPTGPAARPAQVGSTTTLTGTTTLTQVAGPADAIKLALSPTTIEADGRSTSNATATVTDKYGNPVSGDHVAFSSSDAGETIGAVTDHSNGTYTAVITSSTKIQTDVITATDPSVSPSLSASADLTQVAGPAAHLQLVVSPPSIRADGRATSTATATVTDAAGHPVSGDHVTITSSDPGERVGAVTAGPGGVYTATITASTKAETATITATDVSVTPALTATGPLTQTPLPTAPAAAPPAPTAPTAPASSLPFTGARAGEEAALAAGLMGAGIGLVGAARRRRRRYAHSIRR